MNEKLAGMSFVAANMSWIIEMIGLIEAHTALLGILISGSVGISTIIYTRHRSKQLERQNDIAEARLDFDRQVHKHSIAKTKSD